jgi:SAM-dependent methyltransferase
MTARAILGLPRFVFDICRYSRLNPPNGFKLLPINLTPVLGDFRGQAGIANGHYFHQDLWAARKIFERRPPRHVDVGSRIDGFICHLLVFMPVEVIDVRALSTGTRGLTFKQADATQLDCFDGNSIVSISSLHAAEHFGLGRYSDPIDPWSHIKFMQCLQRVLAPGGRLYFSVPIGRERVCFNAHRIFAVNSVLKVFDKLDLCSFSYVDDDGDLHEDVSPNTVSDRTHLGCGLFEFTKSSTTVL